MAEDLGMIACRAMDKAWSLPGYESWQAVADAVVAAHEARRWRAIEEAPDGVAVNVGTWVQREDGKRCWFSPTGGYSKAIAIRHGYTLFCPIPAPPQEGE